MMRKANFFCALFQVFLLLHFHISIFHYVSSSNLELENRKTNTRKMSGN